MAENNKNNRIFLVFVYIIGISLVGSSTLGIRGLLSPPENTSPTQATFEKNLADYQTISAIQQINPGIRYSNAVMTATALYENYGTDDNH